MRLQSAKTEYSKGIELLQQARPQTARLVGDWGKIFRK